MLLVLIIICGLVIGYFYLDAQKESLQKTSEIDHDNHDYDSWEPYNFYAAKEFKAKGRYKISYRDAKGQTSTRIIKVKRVSESDGEYAISAHCELRNAHRHFINSRIINATDADTGEIVKNTAQHAIDNYNNSDEAKDLQIKEDAAYSVSLAWSKVSSLFYVAKADGMMMAKERVIIAQAIHELGFSNGSSENDIQEACKGFEAPHNLEFLRNVKAMVKAKDYDGIETLLKYSKLIVATQKTISPFEQVAIDVLTKALADNAQPKEKPIEQLA